MFTSLISAFLHGWRPSHSSNPPVLLSFRSAKSFLVTVVFVMAFTDIFLYGLIVPVAPLALQQRVGLMADDAQRWTSILLAVYGVSLLVFAPIFGYLADRSSSRRLPLIVGLVILGTATAMLYVGTSLPLWVTGRALQGAAAAVVWTVGLALLADTVDEHELGKYLGVVTLGMTGGTLLGPLLGGIVYDYGGFSKVFIMAFVLIALDIILRLVMIEKKIAHQYLVSPTRNMPTAQYEDHSYDREGRTRNSASNAEMLASSNPTVRRSRAPPVISLLRSRRLLTALFATLVFGIMITGFDSVLPLFVTTTFHWSSTGGGLIFLPVFLPSLLGPWIGHLTDQYGPKLLTSLGFLSALPSYVLLRFVDHQELSQEVLLGALLALIGLSLTLVNTPIFTEIVHIVNAKERDRPGIFGPGGATAQAYGLFNVAFAAGTIVGPIFAGFVREQSGWGTMGWSLGVLSGLTSVPVFLMTGGWAGCRRWTLRRIIRGEGGESLGELGQMADRENN
ncbi:major facilitator superfamily domain-containing protein [Xylariaceae sp. AK1471]|nr:major facilitator superfamily domain-containing protein [Xylariaceae sp. AK1471]